MTIKPWYAVYTRPKWENRVYEQLGKWYHIEAWQPTIKEERKWSDRVKTIQAPVFRGYVFVRPKDEKQRIQVLTLDGVLTYVKYLNRPAAIKEEEITELKKIIERYRDIKMQQIEPGSVVTLTEGELKGRQGVVQQVLKNNVILEIAQLGCRLVASFDGIVV